MTKNTPLSEENTALEDGFLLDYITNEPVPNNSKELVRQRIARALFHEYGISVQDMGRDFPVKVNGKRKKIDIAIFGSGLEHNEENIHRIVICQREQANGKKGAFTIRDHQQAEKDVSQLWEMMTQLDNCRWGLWTNGLEIFFFEREVTRFSTNFKPMGDWPLADESMGSREFYSTARLRKADPEMLKIAFRRCHNFIHGNEGMPKDAAFWQFLYLIFAKMHDEKQRSWDLRRFWAGPTEQFDEAGRKAIRARVVPLFEEVKKEYASIFRGNEEITLSDRALAFIVSELAKYDFTRTDVDAKGAAYQEIVETGHRESS
jgi:type I restriction enzyme M protein